ncbi:hypothetical protein HBE96_00425 [Clostridium sp. P21]|uniref:N-acetyltransferase domain-containing protein n=1 Tax=Clostridium muellerianum TaxID=2716538 RepID=A0A7Y0ED14_9CLOT|nr:hypothetical protein [Clostridium muellerianum]NMM61192.1 hypothetical protein [Clostridium muellerianum]
MRKKELKLLKEFNMEVIKFTPEYECLSNAFNSGELAFNEYISKTALKDKINGSGVTYIVVDKKNHKKLLVAYYTISTSTVHIKDLYDYEDDAIPEEEKREHFSPISAFMINMFAVDKKYQDCLYNNQLVSSLILRQIISNLYDMSVNLIAAKTILLCAVPDAVKFYENNRFLKLADEFTLFDKCDAMDNIPMYLPIHNF